MKLDKSYGRSMYPPADAKRILEAMDDLIDQGETSFAVAVVETTKYLGFAVHDDMLRGQMNETNQYGIDFMLSPAPLFLSHHFAAIDYLIDLVRPLDAKLQKHWRAKRDEKGLPLDEPSSVPAILERQWKREWGYPATYLTARDLSSYLPPARPSVGCFLAAITGEAKAYHDLVKAWESAFRQVHSELTSVPEFRSIYKKICLECSTSAEFQERMVTLHRAYDAYQDVCNRLK